MAAEESRGRALGSAEGDEEAEEEAEEDAEVEEYGGESIREGCWCSGRNERVRGTMRKRKMKEAVGACEDRRRANYWHAPLFFEPRRRTSKRTSARIRSHTGGLCEERCEESRKQRGKE